MSGKARRRPSWRKPKNFYLILINEETDEVFQRIKVKHGAHIFTKLIKRFGQEEAENKLRQAFIDMVDKHYENHCRIPSDREENS